MNKQMFRSGKFAGSLRRRLMREHLGVYKEYHIIIQLAKIKFLLKIHYYCCNITYLPLIGLLPTFIDEVAASAPDSDKNAQSLSDKIASQPVDDCCSDEFYKVSNI